MNNLWKTKSIWLSIIIIAILVSSLDVYRNYTKQQEVLNFLSVEQYTAKYETYNHEQMAKECEKYNLIYHYERGNCLTEQEFRDEQYRDSLEENS